VLPGLALLFRTGFSEELVFVLAIVFSFSGSS